MQNGRGRLPVGNITANPNLRDCLCNAARRGVVFLSHADFVLYNCDCLYLFRLSCLTNVPSAQVDPTGGCASVIPPNESGRPTACRFTYAVINPIRQVIPNDRGLRGKYTLSPQNQKYDFEKSRASFAYLRKFLALPLEEIRSNDKNYPADWRWCVWIYCIFASIPVYPCFPHTQHLQRWGRLNNTMRKMVSVTLQTGRMPLVLLAAARTD